MLQNFPIILSGTSFLLTYYSQNYAHNFYDSCSQFTHYAGIDFTAYNVVLKL